MAILIGAFKSKLQGGFIIGHLNCPANLLIIHTSHFNASFDGTKYCDSDIFTADRITVDVRMLDISLDYILLFGISTIDRHCL